jgi:uncharacterized membrane protein (DUF106 family)
MTYLRLTVNWILILTIPVWVWAWVWYSLISEYRRDYGDSFEKVRKGGEG